MHFSFPRFATILRHPFSCSLQKWSLITKWLLCVFFLEFTPHTESSKIVTITVKISLLVWKSLRVERNSIICGECRRIFFNKKKNTNHSNQMKNTHSMIANTFVRVRTYTQTHWGQVARAKSWRKVTAREKITARNERKEWMSQSRTLLTHFSLRVFQKKI